MKNRIFCLLVLLGLGMQAHATLITFDPLTQTIDDGDSVSVDLVISGLGADFVSTFDLSIFFDDTILTFESFEFGSDCGGFSCLDVLGFDANIEDVIDWGGGEVEVAEVSFDFDEDLHLFQPDEFVLGTFVFSGFDIGVSALDIFVWEVGGAFVFDETLGFFVASVLDVDVVGGSVEVVEPPPTTVPEPGTLALLGIGLAGLGLARRRRRV